MKTIITITAILIILVSYSPGYAPNNNLPRELYAYKIFNLTESRHFEKIIKTKKAMKFESKTRLAKLESLNILNGKEI